MSSRQQPNAPVTGLHARQGGVGANAGFNAVWGAPSGSVDATSGGGNNNYAYQQQQYEQGLGGAAAQQGKQYGNALFGQAKGLMGQGQTQYDQGQQARGYEQNALGLMQSAAEGGQPSAAEIQMRQGIDASIASQMAMANSAHGGLAAAAAQRQAAQQGVAMQQAGVGQAAALRAQEMAQAREAYMQGAAGIRGQDLGAYQSAYGTGLGYAEGGEKGILGSEGLQQGYEGMGVGIENASAQSQTQNRAINAGLSENNQALGAQEAGAGMAAGAAMMAAFADADLSEPGGPAHWTLREENSFILAKNQRTGELRKLLTAPLTDREFRQAMAKHGAGPLGADDPHRIRTVANDMSLGSMAGNYLAAPETDAAASGVAGGAPMVGADARQAIDRPTFGQRLGSGLSGAAGAFGGIGQGLGGYAPDYRSMTISGADIDMMPMRTPMGRAPMAQIGSSPMPPGRPPMAMRAPMAASAGGAPMRPPMQAGMAPAPQRPPMGAGMAVARPVGNYAGGGYGPGYGQPQRPTMAPQPMMGAGLRQAYADLDLAKAHHAKLGSGKRFAAIERSAAASGARDPAAVAAAAGRAAHGERAMERYAAHGRK